jgi:hypothetical protein
MAGLNVQGEERIIDGRGRVHYDGYWIKTYPVPKDSLLAKKQLIEALTRRLFNHVEHGVNIPGRRLDEARHAFDTEADPRRKRVKGAMLAGALFNRAADIFTKLVEIQALGVRITPDNALMRECGDHLQEALELGKMVRHRSGEEGIDELWGEPFKAFAFPVEDFYRSRYIKIAMTMRDIDRICGCLESTFEGSLLFDGIGPTLRGFATAAKAKTETLRTDEDMFEVWTSFVTSAESVSQFTPRVPHAPTFLEQQEAAEGCQLVRDGKDLVSYIARARVPMPKSAAEFVERCARYRRVWLADAAVDKAG